ncbi:MAG: flippase-like domain-containing protein [Chloroflexi bacterium]|nr:flippase-like domain-containing protein [Chloroflexota bacterium]
MLFPLALGLVVLLALAVLGDFPKVVQSFAHFYWGYIPLILALTLVNYVLRFCKWQYYLRLIGVDALPRWDSFLIFFGGLAMVITPGKVGEWLKSFLLKETSGTPLSLSAPIIIAERLTDGLAMLLLASAGLVIYGHGWQLFLLLFVASAGIVVLSQQRSFILRLLAWSGRINWLSGWTHHLRTFYESSYRLLRMDALLLATTIGFVSWSAECVAFFFVLTGLGLEASPLLLLQATFILATSTLIGSISLLPGGLAAAEGSIAGLLLLLRVTVSPAQAATATLLIRLCTLWFGVSVGVATLFLLSRRLRALDIARESL